MSKADASGTPPSLGGADWLARDETQAVFHALAAGGEEARIVGGAVRNALLGRPVKDVDFATTADPKEIVRLAAAAGLKSVPTGIAHGTVTVLVGHTPFEVTSLRHDVETFGRHARVAFTRDWAADAARRDFTINALYVDRVGRVSDPLGESLADIAARRVRFIGRAEDRIREDYLRILRFFRFTAEYAGGRPDAVGLAACAALADGLGQLSAERIRAELLRLLAASDALPAVEGMHASGVLARILPDGSDVPTLARTVALEAALPRPADPLLRLGALALTKPGTAGGLRDRLRLSSAEYERMARMALPDPAFDPSTPERDAKAFLFRYGAEAFRDGTLLAWARSQAGIADAAWRSRLALPDHWQAPDLPVRGADVMALGVPAGPDVGRVLRLFEEWWIAHDLTLDAQPIAAELQRLARMVTSS